MGSRCTKAVQLIFTDERLELLKALLYRSPRDFGNNTSRGLNWQVSDEVTQLLMAKFYQYFLETGDKQMAFKKAQLEIKETYPAPFYWGAFILMNN